MSNKTEEQEIDLGNIISKFQHFFTETIPLFIFKIWRFFVKHIIIIGALFIIGVLLGYFLDKKTKSYTHEIIVFTNFGSSDYLYSKINLIDAKKDENDKTFFSSMNFVNIKDFNKIEIEPIIDIYKFVKENPSNFELVKLMAEDGNLNDIIEKEITSKNYPFHKIIVHTKNKVSEKKGLNSLLAYLNDSEYFKAILVQENNNIKAKLQLNDSTINQIDKIIDEFSNSVANNQKSSQLIYYNENNQISDIINTKNGLIAEQANNKIHLINTDKVIKDISISSNMLNKKGINGKMKLLLPLLFILFFIALKLWFSFIKKHQNKL